MSTEVPLTESESQEVDSLAEKRKQCLLCPLPHEFLRILPYNEDLYARGAVSRTDRYLELVVVEARLAKNYGLTSMNPYCRIRLGDARFETQTAVNSSKHPVWKEVCRLPLHNESHLLSVVIMDEGLLLSDSKVAWTTIPLPQSLLDGSVVDMWYELSGKQGQDLEGTIHLYMRLRNVLHLAPGYRTGTYPGLGPEMQPLHVAQSQMTSEPIRASPARPVTAEDIQAIKEIFPSIEDDTIQTMLEAHGGNRDKVTDELLRMTTET